MNNTHGKKSLEKLANRKHIYFNLLVCSTLLLAGACGEVQDSASLELPSTTSQNLDISQPILFVSDSAGDRDVFLVSSETNQPLNLTNDAADDGEAVFSGNGEYIAFVSDRNGTKDIFRMRPDGTEVEALTSAAGDETQPYLSFDGQLLAYVNGGSGDHNVMVKNLLTEEDINYGFTDQDDLGPVLSPDGSQMAFYSPSKGIYLVDLDTGSIYDVDEQASSSYLPVFFSPDGSMLGFSRFSWLNFRSDIYTVDLSGELSAIKVSSGLSASSQGHAFTADNAQVLLNQEDPAQDLFLMTLDPHLVQVTQLTDTAELEANPFMASDGSFITFERLSEGSGPGGYDYNVMMMDLSDSSEQVLGSANAVDQTPRSF